MTLTKRLLGRLRPTPRQTISHSDLITRLIDERAAGFQQPVVLVESGSGLSTIALASAAQRLKAVVYSCDNNQEKVTELQRLTGKTVTYCLGDSLESLRAIVAEHTHLDLVFLDCCASAIHTWREFAIVEPRLQAGAVLLVDNAALPGERRLRSRVRKGKILVHYLLASPLWEVVGFPTAGDSMIAAHRHSEPRYADPRYEDPAEWIDRWRDELPSVKT